MENYIKLDRETKRDVLISTLTSLYGNHQLTIKDVVDIMCEANTLTDEDKFNVMLLTNHVSASTISRLFGFGYAKSMKIIQMLINEKAIEKIETKYNIISVTNFKSVATKLFGRKC